MNSMVKNSYKEPEELLRIGARIQRFRKQADLSLADLSRLSGVPANTISNIEHGRENPSYSRIFAISKGLGLPISLIVQIDDGTPREIIQESAKELIRFLVKASDEERLKFQQIAFILQRLSKWKE